MKVEKVIITAVDGGSDHIGGISTEYQELKYNDTTIFKIKASTEEANVQLTLTGYEMDSLKNLVWRRI